jgi:hypothetical protein
MLQGVVMVVVGVPLFLAWCAACRQCSSWLIGSPM